MDPSAMHHCGVYLHTRNSAPHTIEHYGRDLRLFFTPLAKEPCAVSWRDIHAFIAAMAEVFPITLAVTAGHPAMVATGPIGGVAVETGLVLAGDDALATDVVGARLLGFELAGVRHLWEAARLGVGEAEISKTNFPRLSLEEAIGRLTEQVYGRRLTFQHA